MEGAKCRLLSFGLGGHSEYNVYPNKEWAPGRFNTSTTSGYASPENWELPGWASKTSDYSDCLVIDARPVYKKDYRLAISNPMFGVTVPDGEVDVCPEPSPLLAIGLSAQVDKTFAGLLLIQANSKAIAPKKPGPLDSIGRAEYVALLRSQGARIGRIVKGPKIEWEK